MMKTETESSLLTRERQPITQILFLHTEALNQFKYIRNVP